MAEMENHIFCRLCCGNIYDDSINIFEGEAKASNVERIILQHFGIEILPGDPYSISICRTCWTVTESFHRLFEIVHTATENLMKLVDAGKYSADSTANDFEDIKKLDDIKTFCGISDLNENGDDNDNVEYLTPISHKEQENDDQLSATEANNADSETTSDTESSSDRSRIATKRKVGRPKLKPFIKEEDEAQRRKREKVEQENQLIRDFFSMDCELCDIKFHTVNEASLHYKRKHNKAGYLTCCGKKFFRRCRALFHIQHHNNPTPFKCDLCEKTFSSHYLLRSHQIAHKQGSEPTSFSCSTCVLTFVNKLALSQHIRRKHYIAEKTFGCDICGKFFETKRDLTTHIRGVHENAFAQICHICARTFKSKQVYTQHLKEHLDQELPKLQCSICGSWLKHERGLRLHMMRHSETEIKCPVCGKLTPNRQALGTHMRYVHNEATYKCTVCDKAFKKPIRLREHMASHTGVDLYACPYCAKTFKSNANMHSHRKKEHFEQWTKDRHQRFTLQTTRIDSQTL